MPEMVSQKQMIKVAVCGIVNAGKSTLLNALQDQVTFETGVVRTTKEAKAIPFSDEIELIDLPGLDANEEDDLYTLRYLKEKADVFMLVHNGLEGELNAIEMNLFNQILTGTDRVLLVHTHTAGLNTEEKQTIEEIIDRQLDRPLRHFYVDSIVYQKGVSEKKKLLQEAGGVDFLKQALFESISDVRLSLLEEENVKKRDELKQQIVLKEQELQAVEQEHQFIQKRLQYVTAGLDEMVAFEADIQMKTELTNPGTIYLNAKRSSTSKRSSESAVEVEAERLFHDQFLQVYDLIDAHQKKWEKIVEEITRYEHSDDSLPYQLEQRILQRLRRLHYLGASQLSDLAFQWNTIKNIAFSFDALKKKSNPWDVWGSSAESWSSDVMSSDHYLSCNLNIYESTEYTRGFFGNEKEVSTYDGSFSAAFRELNQDLSTISLDMKRHYEAEADEELILFRKQIEGQIGTDIRLLKKQLSEEKTKLFAYVKQLDQQRKHTKQELIVLSIPL